MIPALLRGCAITIAIAAAIDPAITSMRRARPEIAVIVVQPARDAALADRVARALSKEFTVLRAPFTAASGTMIVGDRLTPEAGELASPVFAVLPDEGRPAVSIEAVSSPARAQLAERVPINAVTRVNAGRGRSLVITLRAGERIVDRVEREVRSDRETVEVPLFFAPTATAAVPLRVVAEIAGEPHIAVADLLVDVRDRRWAVLFFDPRPSWMSTFVRRAVEQDPRFIVSSRVLSAPDLSTDAGQPPSRLDDFAALERFDALVVGAPESLAERDVAGIDAYMRRRAGSVVLLLDQRAAGAYDRLTNVGRWAGAAGAAMPVRPLVAESGGLRASEFSWPTPLPAGAVPLAIDSLGHPTVWQSAAGAGHLIVSGALDAWRFRDPAVSSFAEFWQTLIADVAAAAAPAIDVAVAHAVVEPGEAIEVGVTLRDAALIEASSGRAVTTTVSAALESPATRTAVRLWPDGIGRLRGSFRAPAAPGTYRIVVSSDGLRADAPVVVATGVSRAARVHSDIVRAWVASRGGIAVNAAQLDQIPDALTRALRPVSRRETWYPMRSVWWIVPFALALGAEWWWRRRRGLA